MVEDSNIPDALSVNDGAFPDLDAVDQLVRRVAVKLPDMKMLSDKG